MLKFIIALMVLLEVIGNALIVSKDAIIKKIDFSQFTNEILIVRILIWVTISFIIIVF